MLKSIIFLGVVFGTLGAGHYYLYLRIFASPGWPPTVQQLGALASALLCLATPLAIMLARRLSREKGRPLTWAAYSWLGLFFMLLTVLALGELPRLLLSARLPETDLTRWHALGSLGITAAMALHGVRTALAGVRVVRIRVPLKRLPKELSGLRVVQLSDLHIGATLGRRWLEEIVARVNALEPALVAITGDLVDGSPERLREHVAPLAQLVSTYGTFFVTGNHEYYSGADAWIQELTGLGVKTLRNERVRIGRPEANFDLAGVDDFNAFGPGHGPDLERALADRDPARELVVLAHQPRQFAEAVTAGVGLLLAGHTHGGQIFPWHFFVRLQQPYLAGLYRRASSWLYVSRGTGFWGPAMRVLAPGEITLLELVREDG